MIYVFHGNDEVFLLEEIRLLAQNFSLRENIKLLEIKPGELSSLYYSQDLFNPSKLFVIDIPANAKFDFSQVKSLITMQAQNSILFYAPKKLEKGHVLLKNLPKDVVVKEFTKDFDISIFNFLDLLFEGKKKEAYNSCNSLLLQGEEILSVFSMITYALRNIAFFVYGSTSFEKLHPFVKSKIKVQAKHFNKLYVSNLYTVMYEVDKLIKGGKISSELLLPLVIEKVTAKL
ncbi:MAG: hypothetical protein AAB443_03340 [Patescibacteria group bacterium]